MTKPYRELVAIQATFSKLSNEYHLTHFYRWQSDKWASGNLAMVGYDMDGAEKPEDVKQALRTVWAPVTLSIWTNDEVDSTAELLQLTIGARPDELALEGTWSLWAEL